jgi:hypothetical protein
MLARVWLFYTGYYDQPDIAGIVSKSQVTTYLDDIIDNGGFELLPNYADLWELDTATNNYNKDISKRSLLLNIPISGMAIGISVMVIAGRLWLVHGTELCAICQGWGIFP